MMKTGFFVHSPFSPILIAQDENKVLLLQFTLSALFSAAKYDREGNREPIFSCQAGFYPYDWSFQSGCLNKIQEHAVLLKTAFPNHLTVILSFQELLEKGCHQICPENLPIQAELQALFQTLMPLMFQYVDNENLLLFLLKNNNEVIVLNPGFWTIFHPDGPASLQRLISENYERRGMASLLPEIELLFEEHFSSVKTIG
jgi:hypothetical protein